MYKETGRYYKSTYVEIISNLCLDTSESHNFHDLMCILLLHDYVCFNLQPKFESWSMTFYQDAPPSVHQSSVFNVHSELQHSLENFLRRYLTPYTQNDEDDSCLSYRSQLTLNDNFKIYTSISLERRRERGLIMYSKIFVMEELE